MLAVVVTTLLSFWLEDCCILMGGNKKRLEKYFNLTINRSIRIYLNISVVLDSHGLLLNIISRKHGTVYKETVQIGGCCSADTMYKKNK